MRTGEGDGDGEGRRRGGLDRSERGQRPVAALI